MDHRYCTSLKVVCDRTWNISTSALNAEQLTVKADRWLSSVLSILCSCYFLHGPLKKPQNLTAQCQYLGFVDIKQPYPIRFPDSPDFENLPDFGPDVMSGRALQTMTSTFLFERRQLTSFSITAASEQEVLLMFS